MDRGRYEHEFLRHLLPGLAILSLCHGYRFTGFGLERDGDRSISRIRLGRGDRQHVVRLDRVVWDGGQDTPPDLMAATLTTAVEEWACAVDTPRDRDVERGEAAI